ncbi:MAG TPA: hypothetical protein VEL09_03115 [Burkholderiales bacterium]|nr:hypothetical protein [Burkholderiales bacterium]
MSRKKTPSTDPSSARSGRLRAQSKDELAALLDELAAKHPEIEARLARHALAGNPAALAAQFRQRLQAWKKSTRFRPRSAAAAFGRELESWLDEIERELLPLDAVRAHALADAFVRADARLFEQADDSDGAIGDAVRAGCRLWLIAAKAQPDRQPAQWIDRIYTLVNADEYGAREALLRHADTPLAPPDLRALAARFEDDLERALARRAGDRAGYPVFKPRQPLGSSPTRCAIRICRPRRRCATAPLRTRCRTSSSWSAICASAGPGRRWCGWKATGECTRSGVNVFSRKPTRH